jgi:hypothetical protein
MYRFNSDALEVSMGTEEDFLSSLKAGQRNWHYHWGRILEQWPKGGFLPMFLHKKAEKVLFQHCWKLLLMCSGIYRPDFNEKVTHLSFWYPAIQGQKNWQKGVQRANFLAVKQPFQSPHNLSEFPYKKDSVCAEIRCCPERRHGYTRATPRSAWRDVSDYGCLSTHISAAQRARSSQLSSPCLDR